MFGSGRELYIGIDQRNYVPKLREQLGYIQYFREHQAENTEKIKAFLAAHDTPYCDAALEIVPYDGSKDLCVYAVVILTHESGLKIRYRTTNMHYFLVGGDNGWYTICCKIPVEKCPTAPRMTRPNFNAGKKNAWHANRRICLDEAL